MIEKHGDLFTSDSQAIGHGVNCAGVMGAGIAKTFKVKYPNNFENYRSACNVGSLRPGGVMVNIENGKHIFNIASQNMPGQDASYPWLFESALKAATGAVSRGLDRIAIPEIGCGIGGLKWNYVEKILWTTEDIAGNDFKWEVWHYA